MSWPGVLDRVRDRWPTASLADLAAATVDQLAYMLGPPPPPDGADRQTALFGLLDDVARRLRVSPAGLLAWPLADVARRASTLAGEDVPEWSLKYGIVKWAAASAALTEVR